MKNFCKLLCPSNSALIRVVNKYDLGQRDSKFYR